MKLWLNAIATQSAPKILVTVATVLGSGPREPGAKMLVTADELFDTIGGGHLEMKATEIARSMLAMPESQLAAQRRFERFPLGPSLGQCCGGVVHLAFERVQADSLAYLNCLNQRWRLGQDSWRLLALDSAQEPSLCDANGTYLTGPAWPTGLPVQIDTSNPCQVLTDAAGQRWLLDSCLAYRAHLMLFGAGHVGAAIVRAMADLPCRITWVDEREDMFPTRLAANVTVEATDTPEALIAKAAPGTSFLVLTHSHALDQKLSEHILRLPDVGWFGLIGSQTKRVQFERRLRERGIPATRLNDMVCPIGLPGIHGKQPAVIAASVVAQLLQVWEEHDIHQQKELNRVLARIGTQAGQHVSAAAQTEKMVPDERHLLAKR
ncbi:xanthine dehydrogenase accessory protein XdhC [Undibacterium sp. YM2]|uniref:xanthine dehydrogenase accessory protein XdhC n=1 Tax=Undibacterium sp. YM2 TaxID=2058625 RepID=UPI001331C6CD|nr:xanthine dehydrogenase accessory protein XdhC [Undibacterium sp. YM2]BBB69730.1 xanthine dehydrogenase accessory protein XdhC [Undibacterium sp. YM2]